MASYRSLKVKCQEPSCDGQAVVEVLDRNLEGQGMFCPTHGRNKLARLNALERTSAGGDGYTQEPDLGFNR